MRILFVTLLLLVSGCQEKNYYDVAGNRPTPLPTNPPNNPTPVQVSKIEYRVSGTSTTVRVRFTNAVDGTTQVISTLPYVATITTNESSMFLSLEASSVSSLYNLYPFMSVQIFVNGVLFREAVSNDLFTTLSVSGTWRR
jgi:hypothetical protein